MSRFVSIRDAVPGDERILAYIQTESWKAAFDGILSASDMARHTGREKTEQMYKRVLCQPEIRVSVEYVDNLPHGMAAWSRNRSHLGEDTAELLCIHSLPGQWRKGYGTLLMRHVLAEMQKSGYSDVMLWVFEQNGRAIPFYEKHGFAPGAQTQNHFGAVERIYWKRL